MRKLAPNEVQQLKHTIEIAREGRATLTQMGAAHELAQEAGCPGCASELRAHIRALAADHDEPVRSAGRDIFTGVVSGVVSTMLLGGLL
jgi:hypothetical protein